LYGVGAGDRAKPKENAMFKAIVAALALSLFACAAEPGVADSTETAGADIVQAEHATAGARDVITVVAVAKVKPGTRAEFAAAAEDLVRGTRREEGNVGYTMLEAKDDPNTFIFIEEWKNQAAIDAHMNGAVLSTFFGLVKDDFLPGYPTITPLDAVSVK
jgi:quinol monooxygenase YgiN